MPSDKDLVDLSEHVLYEMAMLVGIPRQFEAAAENDIMTNVLLEAFVMHARQLVDFFFDHANDIRASEYFENPIQEWKIVRGKEGSDLKDLVSRVGEEIAHLTWRRTKPKEPWNLVEILRRLETLSVLFLERVHPSKVSRPDKDRFYRILQEYKEWASRHSSIPKTPVMVLTSVCSGWPTGITSSPDRPSSPQKL
jgi:hypothetical protein